MRFDERLNAAWTDHAHDVEKVAADLANSATWIESESQVASLAQLITHVYGEHLGRWNEGVALLNSLGHPNDAAVRRSVASLQLACDPSLDLTPFDDTDRVRVLAVAASALAAQGQTTNARELFLSALDLGSSLPSDGPAHRSLAMTGNNLACALEEKSDRTVAERDLMVLAATAARREWELAGTWLEVGRAEYRLAMSRLHAGDLDGAKKHACLALEIAKKNNADSLEHFFGYEALARIAKARHDKPAWTHALAAAESAFEALSSDDKSWCAESLSKIRDGVN